MADISHISIPSFNIDGDINDTIARTTINNHVADKNNPHNVTKAQIGLGNVDNTSDMDKPISTAVQNALDKKANNTLATESSPGLMSAEDKKAVDREFFKLVPRGATYVPHGADLRDNQYFKVGTYYHDVNYSEEKTEKSIIYGMPTTGNMTEESTLAGKPFIMYVMAPFSDKYDDESTANEMTLDRLRVMIVYYAINDAPGESSGPIWIQSAFNRYGKDSGVVEGGQDWFTNNWNAIATDVDLYIIKQYINEHIYNNSNPHNVTKAQVGLEYVDNTADKDKSVNHANTAGHADTAQHAYNAGYADTANHVSWGNVSGKPSTYPPSSHTHTPDQVGLDNVDNTADKDKSVKYAESAGTANSVAWDNVTGKPTTMASSVAWDDITDKPSTYPPSSHTHTPADIGLGNVANLDQSKAIKSITRSGTTFTATALDGTTTTFTQQDADTTSMPWDNVTDKPSTYPPSSHKHTPDEVGLGNVDNTADKDKSVKYAESAGSVDSVAWDNVTDKPSTYPPNAHTHTPAEVGLGNVDNTADIDKPISTAVQKALDGKANNSVATSSTDGLMSKSDKAKLDSIEAGSNVESVNGKTGAVTLNKADIGLGNVDNTADSAKSVKYAESAGSATNDRTGNDIVDTYATNETVNAHISNTNNPHKVTKAQVGLGNVDNTADKDKSVKYAESAGSANSVAWDDISGKPSTFASSVTWDNVTDKPSTYTPAAHTHTPAEVGLGNVDNTADIDKPISTPVQNALNNKVTKNDTADTNGLLNSLTAEETTPTDADYYISQHAGGGTTTTTYHRRPMSALWAFIKSKCDSIYATVSALNAHISNKSNPHGVTKAQVGLGNVDNTADSAKSVKYAASAGSANSVAWGNVSGKPSTYPPSSHTHTPAQVGLGNVANLDQSKAIKSITRNGTTFTATALDGTTSTFTQQDTNTTYGLASQSSNGLMSAADKKAVDREFFRMLPKGGTRIPPNADLNTIEYIKIGSYYNPNINESMTIKNIPVGSAFIMYVLAPLSEFYDNESTDQWVYRLRIFIDYSGQYIFTQLVDDGTTPGNFWYGPWVKQTNSNDLGAVSNTINDHIANKSNPHGVTKAQVGLGNVANLDQSKAIKSITRNGTTFTATALDGTTSTFTQQDTNTWRGITDSYSGTDSGTSLSQKGGNALYNALVNGYASSAGSADTVDGFHEYSFLRCRDSTITNGAETLWNQIGIREYDNALPSGLSGLYTYGAVVSLPGYNTRFDLYYNHNSSSNGDGLYYRTGWGTEKRGWVHLIDSQSIGSQWVDYATSAGHAASADYANSARATLDSVYPVGSIYMSTNSTSPASLFGGTWLPITNRFLFASGSVYAAGETGGEYNHTLTMDEVIQYGMWISDPVTKYNSQIDLNFNTGSQFGIRTYNKSAVAHNNMPPYLVVYMWKRTA